MSEDQYSPVLFRQNASHEWSISTAEQDFTGVGFYEGLLY